MEQFREDLMNIARTTLSSKILSQHKEHFAKLAVDAVLRLKGEKFIYCFSNQIQALLAYFNFSHLDSTI